MRYCSTHNAELMRRLFVSRSWSYIGADFIYTAVCSRAFHNASTTQGQVMVSFS